MRLPARDPLALTVAPQLLVAVTTAVLAATLSLMAADPARAPVLTPAALLWAAGGELRQPSRLFRAWLATVTSGL